MDPIFSASIALRAGAGSLFSKTERIIYRPSPLFPVERKELAGAHEPSRAGKARNRAAVPPLTGTANGTKRRRAAGASPGPHNFFSENENGFKKVNGRLVPNPDKCL